MKFLQCGYGHIGEILFKNEFSPIAHAVKGELYTYDPNVASCPNKVNDLNNHYDVAFVCVPTDKSSDGSADTSIVLDVCKKINAEVIVIKSTIPVNIIEQLPENALFSPEFTGTTQHAGNHNYLVLGGNRSLCNKVAELYKSIHDGSFKFFFTDIKTAIVAKYAENCYLATKVTFFCEIAEVCKTVGIEYEDVRNILIEDSRINSSHTFVYEDHPYYDSHCLNKDIPAFISQFNSPLIKAVDEINTNRKRQITLENK